MENLVSKFKIIYTYKESGQKQVYRIIHPSYGVCIMKVGKCQSRTSLERIKREVSILNEIKSQYFPKNYEFKYDDDGNFTIYEEFIKSKTLTECKDQFKGNEIRVLNFINKVILGMEIIWKKRIVHRDLKPDNILVLDNGNPVIIDLGIARILDEKSLTLTLLQNGPCTPIYASPEQLNNKKDLIDIRSDFYSISIIMAELILGEHPFSPKVVGDGMGVLENLINNKYKLSYKDISISKETSLLIEKLLQKEPYLRIRGVNQLKDKINNIIGG